MASSGGMVKVACVVVMCLVVGAPRAQGGMSCGTVITDLTPCLGYLRSSGGQVPAACCNGVRSLNDAARATADRQTACNCIKSAMGQVSGINMGLVMNLPQNCGVNIPYKISPTTDCSKVK